MQLKDTFTITITEKDHAAAGDFHSIGGCLLATALKRRLPGKKITVGVFEATIDGKNYPGFIKGKNYIGCAELHWCHDTKTFLPSVIGLKVTFRKENI